jgi:DNA-binding NarL/FixJ family response regulator
VSFRILFVDDEPGVLRSMARLMRRRRTDGQAEFVDNGRAALDALARENFDLVVSDMAMPGMDGVALLSEVRKRWPATARLILSGHSTVAHWLCTMPVAHQFLAKPCDDTLLAVTFARLAYIRKDVADPTAASAVTCLPSSPEVHGRMMELLDGGLTPAAVAASARDDIALTAKLLQLANSAFFTLSEPVTTVARAIAMLGLDVIRQLLRSTTSFRPGGAEAVHAEARWEAEAARQKAATDRAEAAGAAALLRSAGRLLEGDGSLGTYLLGLWGLPEQLVAG